MNSIALNGASLPDLDDLLQCPVCYEIPSGQIFQCNEGHHVCGRCKARLDLCPVCRSLFFGTRNYAMEELIANIKKLQAFKLGGKLTVAPSSIGSESTVSADNSMTSGNLEPSIEEEDPISNFDRVVGSSVPVACKGLFRCLCCKNGLSERLPHGRLLNHLRYYHAPDLLEGKSEEGSYVQAWQVSPVPGRVVLAVRVSDMGIFFFTIEITNDCIYAWVTMAATTWVAQGFSYTVTVSGGDREAIFSDCVCSVRSCEGSLKKRGRCLAARASDARALATGGALGARLVLRRAAAEQAARAPHSLVRVATRGAGEQVNVPLDPEPAPADPSALQPPTRNASELLESALSRALRSLTTEPLPEEPTEQDERGSAEEAPPPAPPARLSKSARRRLRKRLAAAVGGIDVPTSSSSASSVQHILPSTYQQAPTHQHAQAGSSSSTHLPNSTIDGHRQRVPKKAKQQR